MGKRYPSSIRKYALYLLFRGLSPKEISNIILKRFGILVSPNTIAKWKERYLKKEGKKEDPYKVFEDVSDFIMG
ncbi:MAG TPA: helix-turn-helix domain-containing protein [Candidatus Nanopusillus sp.]|nr:helix-turn-helix domain-containing protein [Candidatus Nanopusillus sp.]